MILIKTFKPIIVLFICFLVVSPSESFGGSEWPEYKENPFVIKLDPSQHNFGERGGVIVADLNGDGLLDYIFSSTENSNGEGKTSIGAYDHNGNLLWIKTNVDMVSKQTDLVLPKSFAPGISAADVDHDGEIELVHLSTQNEIVIRKGTTGEIKRKIEVLLPNEGVLSKLKYYFGRFLYSSKTEALKGALSTTNGPSVWSHFQLVNLKGENDDEIILQAEPFPFRWLKAISLMTGEVLWENHQYVGLKHGGFRAADIDNDGFDEVVSTILIDDDGSTINQWNYRTIKGHFDGLSIGDILPEVDGLEWVILEESHHGDDRTALLGKEGIYFYHSHKGEEPQNTAIGNFDTEKPGLEIWVRSRFDSDQKPWVIDSSGKTISSYRLNDTKPKGWSNAGIEVIFSIDWSGNSKNLLAAKERHVEGKIGILDPMTGEFIKWWDENAARIYVADVSGDFREEIIVVNSKEKEIRVYWNDDNTQSDKNGNKKRYWDLNHYKRQKLNYNYYSP